MDDRFKIQEWDLEVTSWVKDIRFTYEGQDYSVFLYWDTHDGYSIKFSGLVGFPQWFNDWKEWEPVEYILDSLSEDNKDKQNDQLDQARPIESVKS